ncbi:MAG: flagellin hook IN motif-containing protein [Planctomycetota bacterium]
MQIGGVTGASSGFGAALRFRAQAPPSAASAASPKLSVRDFAANVRQLGDALSELRLGGRHFDISGRGRSAAITSDRDLGLDLTPSPAIRRSSEEINSTSTSFGPEAPDWQGASTSAAGVGGTYNGANGDTTLTFTATLGGIVGASPVALEVTDGNGQVIDTISLGVGDVGVAQTLSNGLEVTLDSGLVVLGDSFDVDVSASVGAAVNPDGAFDQTGASGPNFEAGLGVTSGAFFVNNQRITVSASDTLHDVLATITNSNAGVTATFDTQSERVLLTQNTPGSLERIDLAGDSSGFLDAVKLTNSSLEFGSRNDSEKDIDDVATLSSITNGDFTINGVTFSVNTAEDSLGALIRQINASDAGVYSFFDETTGRFNVRALGQRSLVLDDGTSGIFSALGIDDGVYRGDPAGRKVSFKDESALKRELRDFSQALVKAFEGDVGGYGVGAAKVIRDSLTAALEGTFDTFLDKSGNERLRSGFGLDLSARANQQRTLVVDQAALGRALRRDEDQLADLLFSEERKDGRAGLLERMGTALDRAYRQLEGMLSPEEAIGLRLDVSG